MADSAAASFGCMWNLLDWERKKRSHTIGVETGDARPRTERRGSAQKLSWERAVFRIAQRKLGTRRAHLGPKPKIPGLRRQCAAGWLWLASVSSGCRTLCSRTERFCRQKKWGKSTRGYHEAESRRVNYPIHPSL